MANADDKTLIEPENPLPAVTLDDLSPRCKEAVARAGWSELVEVQAKAIPYMLEGRDMMIQSRTGSGKTGAFILPILELLDPKEKYCQALVLVPTRELAQQVSADAATLKGESELQLISVYGGVGYGAQLDALHNGAQIVIGTPGRILDHLLRRTMDLGRLRVLIFDEADRMMSMGFYPDMREISRHLGDRNSAFMFSATYPSNVRRLAGQFLYKPGFLSLSHDFVHVAETEHFWYKTPAMDKDRALVRIIEVENPESAIIFCNTKAKVNYVATVLGRFGYDADQITADLKQTARDQVLTRLRNHSLRFLVATDLAGRGIDISNLSHVINYEVPEDPESYIHRTGRTGRAGASGIAFTLASGRELTDLEHLARRFEIDIEERPLPTDEDVQTIVSQRLIALLEAKLRKRDRLQVERMKRFMPLARTLGESEDELALLAMVLDDYYQESLHARPPAPSPERSESKAGEPPRRGGSRGRRRPRRP